jgi:acid-sensing ion channel, other
MSQIKKYRSAATDPETNDLERPIPKPLSSHRSGLRSHLRMLLDSAGVPEQYRKVDKNHHESQVYAGVRYLFHSPYDMFSKSSIRHHSLPQFRVVFFIYPQMTRIDDALNDYSPAKRGCYLPNEKPLKFFKKITKENCRAECLANKTLGDCGCAQFFMVREVATRVCGISDMKCYQKVETDLSSSDPCQCLLECGEVVYKIEEKRMDFI